MFSRTLRITVATVAGIAVSGVGAFAVHLGTASADTAKVLDPVGAAKEAAVRAEHAAEVPGTGTPKDHCRHHQPDTHYQGKHYFVDSHDCWERNAECWGNFESTDAAHIC